MRKPITRRDHQYDRLSTQLADLGIIPTEYVAGNEFHDPIIRIAPHLYFQVGCELIYLVHRATSEPQYIELTPDLSNLRTELLKIISSK